jgi:hypothetical protein
LRNIQTSFWPSFEASFFASFCASFELSFARSFEASSFPCFEPCSEMSFHSATSEAATKPDGTADERRWPGFGQSRIQRPETRMQRCGDGENYSRMKADGHASFRTAQLRLAAADGRKWAAIVLSVRSVDALPGHAESATSAVSLPWKADARRETGGHSVSSITAEKVISVFPGNPQGPCPRGCHAPELKSSGCQRSQLAPGAGKQGGYFGGLGRRDTRSRQILGSGL